MFQVYQRNVQEIRSKSPIVCARSLLHLLSCWPLGWLFCWCLFELFHIIRRDIGVKQITNSRRFLTLVGDLVGALVGALVGDLVGDLVGAYSNNSTLFEKASK